MTKLHVVGTERPADALRRMISEAEGLVVYLKGAGDKALRLLHLLDQIDRDLSALADVGLDLRAEISRVEGVHATVRKKKRVLLAELRPHGGLAELRGRREPGDEKWWWYLERELQAERRRSARRYLAIALAALALIAGMALLLPNLLRPDPTVVALHKNLMDAMAHIEEGQLQDAIPLLEENMALVPGEPEWPIRAGVLEQIMGEEARAEMLFELGRHLSARSEDFLIQRGQFYLEAGAFALAAADLTDVVRENPQSAMGHLLLGRSYAGLGRYADAAVAFEQAADVADRGDEAVYVLAKMELAKLMQTSPLEPSTDDDQHGSD